MSDWLNPNDPLDDLLATRDIQFELLDKKNGYAIQKEWLLRFAEKSRRTGKFEGHPMWNGLACNRKIKEGLEALIAYQEQPLESFFIFNEGAIYCYDCTGSHYPDFLDCVNDIYIIPKSMRWTMVYTREEGELGPYFLKYLVEGTN